MARKRKIISIGELPDKDYCLVTDSQDTQSVKDHIGKQAQEFDSFFVIVGDGDYTEVWGFYGIVPYLNKNCYQIV